MVDIYLGEKHLKVTRGAYDNSFKKLGWAAEAPEVPKKETSPAANKKVEKEAELHEVETEAVEEEVEEEIPLSEMNIKQLKEYADNIGVSLEDCKTKKDMREAIIAAQ